MRRSNMPSVVIATAGGVFVIIGTGITYFFTTEVNAARLILLVLWRHCASVWLIRRLYLRSET